MPASLHQLDDNSNSPLSLSQEDVTRLLSEDAPEIRIDILRKVADGYEQSLFGEKESQVAEQIFRTLVRDTEKSVRLALAERLKDSALIPRDIARKLAEDDDEAVALPFVESSPLLSDQDLLSIIRKNPALSRLLAISRRGSLSEIVSSALIDSGEQSVVNSLLRNQNAHIGEQSYADIIEQHSGNEEIMTSMIERPQLPVALAERLISSVSDSLAQTLKAKYGGQYTQAAQEIDTQVEKSRETATLRLLQGLKDKDVFIMVDQLFASKKLTHSLVLSALCHGYMPFFAAAMARLAGIPVPNAVKLLNDRGQLGFPALYARSGLPDTLLPATSAVIRGIHQLEKDPAQPGTTHYADKLAAFVLAANEQTAIPRASHILALIRQNYME